jgi:hypothetical protein
VIPLKEMWTQLRERDLITHASSSPKHSFPPPSPP